MNKELVSVLPIDKAFGKSEIYFYIRISPIGAVPVLKAFLTLKASGPENPFAGVYGKVEQFAKGYLYEVGSKVHWDGFTKELEVFAHYFLDQSQPAQLYDRYLFGDISKQIDLSNPLNALKSIVSGKLTFENFYPKVNKGSNSILDSEKTTVVRREWGFSESNFFLYQDSYGLKAVFKTSAQLGARKRPKSDLEEQILYLFGIGDQDKAHRLVNMGAKRYTLSLFFDLSREVLMDMASGGFVIENLQAVDGSGNQISLSGEEAAKAVGENRSLVVKEAVVRARLSLKPRFGVVKVEVPDSGFQGVRLVKGELDDEEDYLHFFSPEEAASVYSNFRAFSFNVSGGFSYLIIDSFTGKEYELAPEKEDGGETIVSISTEGWFSGIEESFKKLAWLFDKQELNRGLVCVGDKRFFNPIFPDMGVRGEGDLDKLSADLSVKTLLELIREYVETLPPASGIRVFTPISKTLERALSAYGPLRANVKLKANLLESRRIKQGKSFVLMQVKSEALLTSYELGRFLSDFRYLRVGSSKFEVDTISKISSGVLGNFFNIRMELSAF